MAQIDIQIGKTIRARRTILGLSQDAVGKRMGITFQQVQKYEKGSNAMTISRLYEMAAALEWNVMALLTNSETVTSHSDGDTRTTLEIMKRIQLLKEPELKGVTALINHLVRGRQAV